MALKVDIDLPKLFDSAHFFTPALTDPRRRDLPGKAAVWRRADLPTSRVFRSPIHANRSPIESKPEKGFQDRKVPQAGQWLKDHVTSQETILPWSTNPLTRFTRPTDL